MFEGQMPEETIIDAEKESLINRIKLSTSEALNESILEEDEEVFEYLSAEDDTDIENHDPLDIETDQHLAEQLEMTLPTPPPDDEDPAIALHAKLGRINAERPSECSWCEINDNSFVNKTSITISSPEQGAFAAGRLFAKIHKSKLPPPPKTMRDLDSHPMKAHFLDSIREHFAQHHQMETFQLVDKKHAKGHKVLGCMWVFTYKTDSDGCLQKCKARLVVCGNQQEEGELPTKATTLASSAFRTLIALVAKFDLETIQMDAVNAFVNCDLDEVVYMRIPPYYSLHPSSDSQSAPSHLASEGPLTPSENARASVGKT